MRERLHKPQRLPVKNGERRSTGTSLVEWKLASGCHVRERRCESHSLVDPNWI